LTGDLTQREKVKLQRKEKRANAAKKAAETRKRKTAEKRKAEDDKFMQRQRELGYRDLFGN
jgi:hypothetical protein